MVDPAPERRGPLHGVRVLEVAGIGPGPFCGMLLADMGADVIRVDRPDGHAGNPVSPSFDLLNRGRRSVVLDLKHPEGAEVLLRLAETADVLLEGFRPGVAERLGIGPDTCRERNPRLVYGRMTGWGQDGPLSARAGHDINYIALAGALGLMGPADGPPTVPVNLLGDFGGGAMFLAFGVVCAVLEARASGQGQVVDASIVDGTALLTTIVHGLRAQGLWGDRAENLLDGGAHFYGVYECADGRFVSIGAVEPRFYRELLDALDLADDDEFVRGHEDRSLWPRLRDRLSVVFRDRTRDEWTALLSDRDVCFAPVLNLDEVAVHPHNRARETFTDAHGLLQPAPAPRFSRSVPGTPGPPALPGADSREVLTAAGFTPAETESLLSTGVVLDRTVRSY
ncbi:CaiB/BaiF CoA transferase family protein [Amycolatopsis nalaikhensis]|uniref:CaiB/BaiF CoA-transferase family protein n=1 Tax=Amycolatopsis nalaikhensis TaxID=715472 RepID=A0ABY8XIF3_9PSEU|nr:CaiB/BaiF CoA-transferase family protein [Amycolatopsis sp. 2-2]WIV55404.1 CaiB/BaiF CoA-transferase family protein [Amycolatopsis sp. 2-2]